LPLRERLPIVALTANVASGERERCIDAGAAAYVSKPLESSALLAVLHDCLEAPALAAQASNGGS
jgi:CheY-like chemotaxis protein